MEQRVLFVREHRDSRADFIIEHLTEEALISKYYSESCLDVDKWYVGKMRRIYTRRPRLDVIDPESRIFLEVIVLALIDYANGRPCDVSVWRIDLPPGNIKLKCRPSEHVCINRAEKFLADLSASQEVFAGLSPGTVKHFMKKVAR